MSSARNRPRHPARKPAASPVNAAKSAVRTPVKSTAKLAAAPSRPPPLVTLVTAAMADMKAVNVKVLNVIGLTDIADYMIVASGNSDRHVKSIAERVVQQAKAAGKRPYGTEGEQDGEWVLVDLPDVMVHVMLPRVREFYALEELWDNAPRAAVIAAPPSQPARKRRKAPSKDAARGKPRASAGSRTRRPPRG
jgi:ribosome-associated protein